MDSPESSEGGFAKETSVYHIAFRLAFGLFLFWLLLPLIAWVAPEGPVAGIAFGLLLAIPFVLIFVTGILSLWGIFLVCLGMRQKEPVLALTHASIASSVLFLLLLGLFVLLSV